MFKKVILVLAMVAALPIALCAQKFGVVDVQTVMTALPEFTQMQDQIATASKEYETEFTKLRDEMNKKIQEYEALAQDTPQAIRERRESELQEYDQKIQQFRNNASQQLQQQQQKLMEPIEKKLIDAINAVGQEGAYTFIFQKGQSVYEGVDVKDLTDEVKAKLGIK